MNQGGNQSPQQCIWCGLPILSYLGQQTTAAGFCRCVPKTAMEIAAEQEFKNVAKETKANMRDEQIIELLERIELTLTRLLERVRLMD
jgi:hypothetical protein